MQHAGRGNARRLEIAVCLLMLATAAHAGTLTVTVTHNGEPLPDPSQAKIYLYEPEETDEYVAWGHSGRPIRVGAGVYAVTVRYVNDQVREERRFEEVDLTEDLDTEVDFDVPLARLHLDVTSGDRPVPRFSGRFSIYRRGQRGQALVSKRPGDTVTLRPGTYDIEITYRDHQELHTLWLERYVLEGERYESIEMGQSLARLTLTLTEGGRSLAASEGRWGVFEPGERKRPLAERHSGESAEVEPGLYDLGISFRQAGQVHEQWLTSVLIRGNQEKEIDIGVPSTSLRVDVTHRGRRLTEAWVEIYVAGRRDLSLRVARSGERMDLEPGRYDVGAFLRDGGIREARWIVDREVSGPTDLEVEMDFELATLRVMPRRKRGTNDESSSNVLVMLDSSAEMRDLFDERSRQGASATALEELAASYSPDDINFGLRVHGIAPKSQRDCRDSTLIVPIKPLHPRLIHTNLELLRPAGLSPIAYSLERAATDLDPAGRNAVILILGAGEGCGGDPCAAAIELVRQGVVDSITTLGLGLGPEVQAGLECLGDFRNLTDRRELRDALRATVRATLDREGSFFVFRNSGGEWLARGHLGTRVRLAADTYDIMIRQDGKAYFWNDVEVSGDFDAVAAPRLAGR